MAEGAAALPVLSVVVVNYRGADDTITCLRALRDDLDYPADRLQVICVDNASGDGSAERIAATPGVELIKVDENLGFAGAADRGAAVATGSVLAFLANTARPHRDWATAAVRVLAAEPTVACVASRVRRGSAVDSGADTARDILFPTRSAMFVRAEVFTELDGFDDRFQVAYEDVDLGWRMSLRGRRVRHVPSSVVHQGDRRPTPRTDIVRETRLRERDALAALCKNCSDTTLTVALPAALALLPGTSGEMSPALREARAVEQAARVRSDADLVRLTRDPDATDVAPLTPAQALVRALGIEDMYGRRRNVLVLTPDTIAARMAGPAIRAWNMADVLSGEHDVRLITLSRHSAPPPAPFPVLHVPERHIADHLTWADVVILQGHALEQVPHLRDSDKVVVCDIYDPMHLEQLEQGKDLAAEDRAHIVRTVTGVLTNQLKRGDYFLCASERQRHFWLGHLGAIGRLTPILYDADPTVRSLLDVAPFGLSAKPPQRTGPGARDSVDGIGDNDKLVIWAGGVYNWFDPLTLVSAMDELRRTHGDAKLLFLGMKHPNPDVGEMDMAGRTRALAGRLGLTGEHVFFNETWIPYEERQNWLLDADCGVTTHFEHVETTFAFRTRVLDYLWAGLPIVTSAGDAFADLVAAEGLGVVVPAEDPSALAEALRKTLYDEEFAQGCRERIAAVRERYTWDTVLAPLVEFCRNPRPAADRLAGGEPLGPKKTVRGVAAVRRDVALVREYLDSGGAAELARRAGGRVLRKLRGRHG